MQLQQNLPVSFDSHAEPNQLAIFCYPLFFRRLKNIL